MDKPKRYLIHISGIVQGVGFRPFVFNLANKHNIKGWVKNTSSGVKVEIEGFQKQILDFTTQLKLDAPPLASLDQINIEELQYLGYVQFEILHSESAQSEFQPISSDVAICDDCLRELWDSSDRRHRYPFINCTNCGPRFSIIQDIPYDRPNTCMSVFEMCPECFAEYQDPENRRFHAQPIACPNCGPKIWFEQIDSSGAISVLGNGNEAIKYTRTSIRNGQIVAIKGLGGFHLSLIHI